MNTVSKFARALFKTFLSFIQGVVVIEDVKRMKAKLLLKGTSNKDLVECLDELGRKIPPRNVMMETKIGITSLYIL